MQYKEIGFRAIYHQVCAFKFNEELRDLSKDCPEAGDSTHAVMYGYIDPKKGLMLELLGTGKMGRKYFYFKAPWTGRRITIPLSDVENVDFVTYTDLDPNLYNKYLPRIEALKKYNVSENVEKSRQFPFLDGCRDPYHPDKITVRFMKNGLKPEELPVQMSDLGDHFLVGTLLKKPKQNFGPGKGDAISFHTMELDNKTTICAADFTSEELHKEDFDNGTALKSALTEFRKNPSEETFNTAMVILRNSSVCFPMEMHLTEEAREILEKLKMEGKDQSALEGEELERFQEGSQLFPPLLSQGDKLFFPVFTNKSEFGHLGNNGNVPAAHTSFLKAMRIAQGIDDLFAIVINPFTENLIVEKKNFKNFAEIKPIFPDEDDSPAEEPELSNTARTHKPSLTNMKSESDIIYMAVGKADVINYALYKNDVPAIRGVRIANKTKDPIAGLKIRVTSDSEIFDTYEQPLPLVQVKYPLDFDIPLTVHGKQLTEITEAIKVNLKMELVSVENDTPICPPVEWMMDVLTYDESAGKGYEPYLAAFIMPNHPYLPELQNYAVDWLKKNKKSTKLDQYFSGDRNKVRDFAAACFAAIQKKNINYLVAPAGFGQAQRIRTIEKVLDERLGNCMEMTMLYASLIESIGLAPVLIEVEGHIFAGVRLTQPEIGDPIIRNGNIWLKDPNLTLIECTMMCSNKEKIQFEEAEAAAKSTLEQCITTGKFECGIDIFSVRQRLGIKPVDARVSTGTKIIGSDLEDNELTSAPKPITFAEVVQTGPEKASGPKNKIELWESKLLDLSGRNKLLNIGKWLGIPAALIEKYKDDRDALNEIHHAYEIHGVSCSPNVISLISGNIAEFEDSLSDYEEFDIKPEEIYQAETEDDKGKSKIVNIPWHERAHISNMFEEPLWNQDWMDFTSAEFFRTEAKSHRLYALTDPKDLNNSLKKLYRKAKEAEKEYGINSLYLALGMLRWFDPEDENQSPLYAPLILAPVEIEMKPGGVGYNLRRRFEDPHFNVTLLELLRQRFELGISGLEPLPQDEHGLDVPKIFAIVKGAVRELPHWDVVETAAIGIFDISKISMWNDLHTAPEMLMNNKAVRSLVMQRVDWDVTAKPEAPENYTTFVTLPVDATQLEAIDLAGRGNTFVLHGPPGTGKSQTITGMIGNALANHKTVLFVAEKATALNVVRDRLQHDLGIGDFCLALHADSEKTAILEQMDKTMGKKAFNNNPLNPFKSAAEKTEVRKEKLDIYADHLHRRHNCGYSLRELIDLYCREPDEAPYISFKKEEAAKMTASDLQSHIPLIEQLLAAKRSLDDEARSLMHEIGLSVYNGEVRSKINHQTEDYQTALHAIMDKAKQAAGLLNLTVPQNFTDLTMLARRLTGIHELAETKSELPDISKVDVKGAQKYFSEADSLNSKRSELLKLWSADFLRQDPSVYREKLAAAQKKILFLRKNAVNQVMNELESYAHRQLSESEVPRLLREIEAFRSDESHLETTWNSLSNETRSLISQYNDPEAFRQAYTSAASYQQREADLTGGRSIHSLRSTTKAAEIFAAFRESWQQLQNLKNEINSFLGRSFDKTNTASIQDEMDFCNRILENRAGIKKLALYNQYKQACIKAGLAPVVQACEDGMDDLDTLKTAYRKGLYYALINDIIYHDDLLTTFTGETFNTSIEQYKRLDDDLQVKSRNELFHRLAMNLPADIESPAIAKQMTILRKAIKSRGRGIALRQLFEQIPDILYRICPCMLMSPETVAQYLPQKNDLFDLVVFDEASQISTSRAIGALARGKDAVIVGDPEQMPPTNFFGGGGPRIEAADLDDLDSILDDALAIGIPSRYLKWHYRSSHESLIAFSNRNFYHNEMFTFPSVDDRARRVRRIWVDSNYKKSVNENEAKAIVKEIIRRYKADPQDNGKTIGIIAFNEKQRDYIDDLLQKQCLQDRGLNDWVHQVIGKKEKVEIKPLEKVQGDEWDTVIFSITFGPDEKGHVLQNFGPINKEGGGKRLNVAFSRAVREMLIFTGLRSADIKLSDATPAGARAFHDFLEFAERLDTVEKNAVPEENHKIRSGIVQRISSALSDHGYICVPDIGTSDFHIDIGVLDPYDPSQYLLGIMLDGETYKQTKNTRDREIGQKGLLEGKFGWKLWRIWAIDWWEDQKDVLELLLEKLDDLKTEAEKAAGVMRGQEQTAEVTPEEDSALDAELTQQADEIESEMDDADYEPELTEEPAAQSEVTPPAGEMSAVPEQLRETEPEPISEVPAEDVSEEETAETADHPEPQEEPVTGKDQTVTASDTLSGLLSEAGIEIIDKRNVGGLLWIIGGRELEPLAQRCREIGVNFNFKAGGGKVCKGRDAWWTSDKDPVFPVDPEEPGNDTPSAGEIQNAAETNIGSDDPGTEPLTENSDSTDEIPEEFDEGSAAVPDEKPYTGKLYVYTDYPVTNVGWQDYCQPSNKAEIIRRAVLIVEGEGVIERRRLVEKLRYSFGVVKNSEQVTDATEKALKAAKIKTTKVRGIPYCWASAVDPKTYTGYRYHEEVKRNPEDLTLPEMRNAAVRALMDNGPLSEDELLFRISRVFGYQRLGPNLRNRLLEGIEFAVYDKKIRLNRQKKYELREG